MSSADPESGDLETIGAALASIGFWGASDINPKAMQNNCVSVALSRLMNYETIYDLWKATYKHNLPDQPLSLQQITELLGRTGWKFEWQKFWPEPKRGKTAFQIMKERGGYTYPTNMVAVYIRADGSGHAVNAEFDMSDWKMPVYFIFKDFQHSSEGEQCYKDVEGATRIILISLVTASDPKQLERLIKEMDERAKKLPGRPRSFSYTA